MFKFLISLYSKKKKYINIIFILVLYTKKEHTYF